MEIVHLKILPRAPGLRLGIAHNAEPLKLHLEAGHSVDWYEGPYEVVPKRQDQTLPTKDKTMNADVLVHEIPYYQTANPYGTTFVIGE